jgi:hypothetical protein
MRFNATTTFVAGAITALVLGSGTAVAATGGKFILGRSNAASTITTLTNKYGTALTLNSKAGQPSLRVNRNVKVPNLNADLLDGLDQTSLARASMRTGAGDVAATGSDTDGSGGLDFFYAKATCPSGTQRTGGGIGDFTATGVTLWNGPDVGNSWSVGVSVDETVDMDPTDVYASVVCLNPKGSVAGGYRTDSQTSRLDRAREAAAARAAAN